MFYLYDIFGRSLAEKLRIDWVLQILDQVVFRAFGAVVLSFLFVIIFGKPVIRWLVRKKIGDTGATDAAILKDVVAKKKNTPTMGGILIVGAILFGTLMMADLANFYILLGVIVLLWLAVLGGFDDWLKLTQASRPEGGRQGLYGWEKLVFQFGIGLIVTYFCYNHSDVSKGPDLAHVLNMPFQKTYSTSMGEVSEGLIYLPGAAYIALGILVITGLSNAVNITDGMDGLAAGITSAVSLGLVVLCLIAGKNTWAYYLLTPNVPGSGELAIIAGSMAGACLGFLWFNCSPADVFMGDTGSLALGGLIGYIATVTRQELLVLFMCGVFLWEIFSVVLQVSYFKFTKGKRVFLCAPYHHHLHHAGWPEQRIVARAWIIGVLMVVLALATIKMR